MQSFLSNPIQGIGNGNQQVFVSASIVLGVLSILGIIVSGGDLLYSMIWSGPSPAAFPDFAQTLYESYGLHPYSLTTTIALYPPLVYVVFHLFAALMPADVNASMMAAQQGTQSWLPISYMPAVHVLEIAFFAVASVFLGVLIARALKATNRELRIAVLIIVFLSAPYIYAIDRGNVVLMMIPLLLFFCLNFDSDKLPIRLLAYSFFAIAFCFKLYTVIFGAVLFKAKHPVRYIGECALVTLAFFVIPGLVLESGIESFQMMIDHISLYAGGIALSYGPGHEVSLSNTARILYDLSGFKTPLLQESVSTYVMLGVGVLSVVSSLLFTSQWKRIAILTLCAILAPVYSWHYNLLYLVIPLVLFLKDEQEGSIVGRIYAVLFAVCLVPIAIGPTDLLAQFNYVCVLNLGTIVPSFALIVFFLVLLIDCVIERMALCNTLSK